MHAISHCQAASPVLSKCVWKNTFEPGYIPVLISGVPLLTRGESGSGGVGNDLFPGRCPTGAQPAFGLTQNGRAGMQMLGAIQEFSSTKMREAARTCFDESEAGQALIAEQDRKSTRLNSSH